MNDWHSLEPKRSAMTLEDAHGGELLRIIQESEGKSNNIIQSMASHAPMVANQLMMLDHHYHETLRMVEQALRTKRIRPANELEQLEILAEFNEWVGHHGPRTNIKVTFKDHGQEYGVRYGGGSGKLPLTDYMAREGKAKVTKWYADRTPSGQPRITEILEAGKKSDGYIVVSEVIDETSMEEVTISKLDFVHMLLKDWDTEPSEVPLWHDLRICYTRKPMYERGAWSFIPYRYIDLAVGNRTILSFEFQYAYPFWVGERTDVKYNIFNDRTTNALCFESVDKKYAFVFYKTSSDSQIYALIYEHATASLKTWREEWYVREYLKNALDILESERNPISVRAYDLRESHPFTTISLMPNEIPESIKDREEATQCTRVTFNEPQLIADSAVQLCSHVYIYKTESADKPAQMKMHFEYQLVEKIDLAQIVKVPDRRY